MDGPDAARRSDTEEPIELVPEDAGPPYPTISADAFLDTFLPKVPEATDAMDSIINWVVAESGEYANGRWKSFTQDPSEYRQPTATVFRKLRGIVNAIHNAVKRRLPELRSKLQTRYYTCPPNVPKKTRPDCCFALNNERLRDEDTPGWTDSAVTGQFEKDGGTSATRDNTVKIIWNMDRVFLEDPRRRYTFGYTIENRTFRMWFASRSEIVVSSPIDFFKEPEYIIRFFFAFMYASPTEMGWDPTMKMVWEGDNHIEPQYEITVQSKDGEIKVFRTIGLISAIGAESIRGRGTRVWQVREVEKDGLSETVYVLKDTWIDSDRKSEGEVVAQIEQEARATLSPSESAMLIKCLLTTYIAGPVVLSSDRTDSTIDGRKRTRLIKGNTRKFVLQQAQKSSTPSLQPSATKSPLPQDDPHTPAIKTKLPTPTGRAGIFRPPGAHHESADENEVAQKSIVYSAKTHYRIVFEEVCEVLHEIKSLQTVIWALRQACIALRLLHKLGWVHRDLSSGNLMLGRGQLKIADFEYAKKMTEPRTEVHDIRTGTEDFMSVEVRSQEYIFTEPVPGFDDEDEDDVDTEDEDDDEDESTSYYEELANTKVGGSNLSFAVKTRVFKKAHKTWFYNPLHDFESIFWLTLHFLINKDFHCIPDMPASAPDAPREVPVLPVFEAESNEQRKSRIISHWNFGRSLFAGRAGRAHVLGLGGTLRRFLEQHPLHPALAPLDGTLERMRKILVAAYRRVERNTSTITHASARRLPQKFIKLLDRAVRHIGGTGHLISIQSLKRAVDALPRSDQTQREDAPLTIPSLVVSSAKKRRKPADDDEYVPAGARKSKSPRISADHTSPTSKPPSSKNKKAESGKRKAGKGQRRRLPPTCAPFFDPKPQSTHSEDIPRPPPLPPTRVLRSQTRNTVGQAPAPPAPPASPPMTRARKTTTAGRRTRGAAKAKETAKAAEKVASKPKPKPKPRARKARGT